MKSLRSTAVGSCSRNTGSAFDTVLNASDEILEISPTEAWKTSLRIQLLPHRDYLLSPHFKQSGYLDQYGTKLHPFLREILNEPKSSRRTRDKLAFEPRVKQMRYVNMRPSGHPFSPKSRQLVTQGSVKGCNVVISYIRRES